jgi:hypothetical protein
MKLDRNVSKSEAHETPQSMLLKRLSSEVELALLSSHYSSNKRFQASAM